MMKFKHKTGEKSTQRSNVTNYKTCNGPSKKKVQYDCIEKLKYLICLRSKVIKIFYHPMVEYHPKAEIFDKSQNNVK